MAGLSKDFGKIGRPVIVGSSALNLTRLLSGPRTPKRLSDIASGQIQIGTVGSIAGMFFGSILGKGRKRK